MSRNDENKGFCMFFDWIDDLDHLGGDGAWKVVKALCDYYRDGINPVESVTGDLKAIVSLMFHQIKRQENISEIRSKAGRNGGFATAKNSKATSKARQKPATNTKTKTNTNTNTNTHSPPNPLSEGNASNGEGFDEFWTAYPKKKAKEQARKAWDKLKPDEDLRKTIIKAVEAAKHYDWKKNNGQYIPFPSTYLNGKRWEDEYTDNSVTDHDEWFDQFD